MSQRCPLTLLSNLVHDSGLALTPLIDLHVQLKKTRVRQLTSFYLCDIHSQLYQLLRGDISQVSDGRVNEYGREAITLPPMRFTCLHLLRIHCLFPPHSPHTVGVNKHNSSHASRINHRNYLVGSITSCHTLTMESEEYCHSLRSNVTCPFYNTMQCDRVSEPYRYFRRVWNPGFI